jgi:spore germination protein KC
MNRERIFLAALFSLLLLFSAGCWDQAEIEDLAIVRGVAIDYLPGRRAPYLVTLAVKRPAAIGGEEGGDGGKPLEIYSGLGASIDLAVQQATFSLSRRLFLSHSELIVIGEEAAKQGVHGIMDFAIRNPQVRLNAFVLVTPGMGHEIFTVPERLKISAPEELLGLIRQADETSESDPQEVFTFLRQMATPGQDPYTAVVQASPKLEDEIPQLQPEETGGQGEKQEGNGGGGEQEKILTLDGMAVFRGDKMAGILNYIEARGVLWLRGEIVRSIIAVDDPEHPHHIVNLLITRSQTKVTPVVENGHISFRVEIEAEGDIMSQTSQVDLSTPEMLKILNSAQSGAIKEEIKRTMERLQELETDVVGFGKLLNIRHPETFREVADRWPEVFSQIELDIHVTANIRRTGQHSHPTRVNR